MTRSLRGKSCCVGLATFGMGEAPGFNSIDIMANAVLDALEDAQIALSEVDGLFAATAVHAMATLTLAEHLGISPTIMDNSNIGGSSFMQHVLMATLALDAGLINVAVVAYGSNQRTAGGFQGFSEPLPYESEFRPKPPVTSYALVASRYLHRFGLTRADLAQIPVAARKWANLNPQAFSHGSLTVDDVLAARMISDPLGKLDCCLVTDGGGAIVLTRPDRARDTPHTPVYMLGAGVASHHRMVSSMPDLTVTAAVESGSRAYEMAGYGPKDMDTVQLYDAFSITPLLFLEDLGFCPKGEAARFVAGGRIEPGGDLAMNTNGGGLSCVHPGMYGLFLIIEAIQQIRSTIEGPAYERGDGGWRKGAFLSLAHGNGGVLSSQATTIWGAEDTL